MRRHDETPPEGPRQAGLKGPHCHGICRSAQERGSRHPRPSVPWDFERNFLSPLGWGDVVLGAGFLSSDEAGKAGGGRVKHSLRAIRP